MSAVDLFHNSVSHCFSTYIFSLNLNWNDLFSIGLLVLVFELAVYFLVRLKDIYLPVRFLVAIMILSAILLAEILPYLFLQLRTGPC
jgi:hypothetical protein